MTALIATGHSIDQKNDDVKGSFRPEAVIRILCFLARYRVDRNQ